MTTGHKNAAIIGASMKPQTNTPALQDIFAALEDKEIRSKFMKVKGDATPLFIQTIYNVLSSPPNKRLRECSKNSIIRSCMACATTGLTLDPAFGEAALVPFGNQATFMPMKNGLVHLANNTGMFRTINAAPVYDGYILDYNPITGKIVWDKELMLRLKMNPQDRILIGYTSYIEMLNGYEHTLFWTTDEILAHGRKYSKTFGRSDSLWQTNFPVMAEKTLIKQNLTKWGSLDTMANSKLWLALKFDQSTPSDIDVEKATAIYPDAADGKSDIEDADIIYEKGGDNE